MSPRTGRPPKSDEPKKISLQLRLTQTTADNLQRCASELRISRTEVIEKGINLVCEEIGKEKE